MLFYPFHTFWQRHPPAGHGNFHLAASTALLAIQLFMLYAPHSPAFYALRPAQSGFLCTSFHAIRHLIHHATHRPAFSALRSMRPSIFKALRPRDPASNALRSLRPGI
jgi:hypothetical protein